jgi:two-component system LytT family response regulator
MNLNCLVIDDEPAVRRTLEEYIRDSGFLYLIASCPNPAAAAEIVSTHEVNLLFLDVQMPKMNGIDFLKSLTNPPMVIMVTAYSEYALQGYDLNVLDYLLKPISQDRFLKACHKAREFWELKNSLQKPDQKTHFFIKCNSQYERIRYDELLFVEAADNYVTLQVNDRKFSTYLTFKAVSDYLPSDQFIKVHKSFIVAVGKIESIDGEKIRIAGHSIPISRGMRNSVLDQVLNKNVIRR